MALLLHAGLESTWAASSCLPENGDAFGGSAGQGSADDEPAALLQISLESTAGHAISQDKPVLNHVAPASTCEGAFIEEDGKVTTDAAATAARAADAAMVAEQISQRAAAHTEECDLCARQWLLVLATGRSGSTSVMDMVRALPDVYISGENCGFMYRVMQAYRGLMYQQSEPSEAWQHRLVSERRSLCAIQDLVYEWLGAPSERVVGFKEIRHDFAEQLDFMRMVFPCGRFVTNARRDLAEQLESFKETHMLSRNGQNLQDKTQTLVDFAANHTGCARMVYLEDFSTDSFNALLPWMNVTGCMYKRVLHDNNGGFTTDKDGPVLEGECKVETGPCIEQ